jgi:SAM-dependent methyltransferase
MHRRYRRRIALFLVAVAVAVGLLSAATWTLGAMRRVDVVESERDRWQRPGDILQVLSLSEGKVVVDLGSGVGYFALKLADQVGTRGRVLAVDVRRFPLLFLRIRALLSGRRNLSVVHGEADDPRLPAHRIDAVLVANTYHELTSPGPMLDRLFEALCPNGRLVIVDPGPDAVDASSAHDAHRHQSPEAAEARLRQVGFEVLSRDDSFVDVPGHGRWWLIVARRPQGDAQVGRSGAAPP